MNRWMIYSTCSIVALCSMGAVAPPVPGAELDATPPAAHGGRRAGRRPSGDTEPTPTPRPTVHRTAPRRARPAQGGEGAAPARVLSRPALLGLARPGQAQPARRLRVAALRQRPRRRPLLPRGPDRPDQRRPAPARLDVPHRRARSQRAARPQGRLRGHADPGRRQARPQHARTTTSSRSTRATGAKLWEYDAALDRSHGYSEVTSRGVAAWRDRPPRPGRAVPRRGSSWARSTPGSSRSTPTPARPAPASGRAGRSTSPAASTSATSGTTR